MNYLNDVSFTPRFSEVLTMSVIAGSRFNGAKIFDSPTAPKALDVIARPNGPGGDADSKQSAESAKCYGFSRTGSLSTLRLNYVCRAFSAPNQYADLYPGRWPGL